MCYYNRWDGNDRKGSWALRESRSVCVIITVGMVMTERDLGPYGNVGVQAYLFL
jgi:hypothetical protein